MLAKWAVKRAEGRQAEGRSLKVCLKYCWCLVGIRTLQISSECSIKDLDPSFDHNSVTEGQFRKSESVKPDAFCSPPSNYSLTSFLLLNILITIRQTFKQKSSNFITFPLKSFEKGKGVPPQKNLYKLPLLDITLISSVKGTSFLKLKLFLSDDLNEIYYNLRFIKLL